MFLIGGVIEIVDHGRGQIVGRPHGCGNGMGDEKAGADHAEETMAATTTTARMA